MGVKTLWSVVSGTGEMLDLKELQGKSVAIDLAGWIVQNNSCKGMNGVSRPYLRNLFFRTNALINLNIQPVFVMDGSAPELKKDTLEARLKAEGLSSTQSNTEIKPSLSRKRLKGLMNQSKELLESIGVKVIKSNGEAEKLCAKLNADGIVDAVISDDSDCFCYGARTILRNFCISSSGHGASVEKYTIEKIKKTVGLSRDRLVIMAILLGCDFFGGVPGIGKESILQLFEHWPIEWDTLKAFKLWMKNKFEPCKNYVKGRTAEKTFYKCKICHRNSSNHCGICDDWSLAVESWSHCHCSMLMENKTLLKSEETIKKKCAEHFNEFEEFWSTTFDKIIQEFMNADESCKIKKIDLKICSPQVNCIVDICISKLSWTQEYALEKALPIISRWQVNNPETRLINPIKILKKRTIQGNLAFVVEWMWCIDKPNLAPEQFQTCEPAIFLANICQDLLDEFEESKKKKPPKKVTTKKVSNKQSQKSSKVVPVIEKDQKPITQFFQHKKEINMAKILIQKKNSKTDITKSNPNFNDTTLDTTDEYLPNDFSFLVDDIIGQQLKRNLSISDQPEDSNNEILTSTPVRNNSGPCKKLITPSKITEFIPKYEENAEDIPEEEDSFDRMCK